MYNRLLCLFVVMGGVSGLQANDVRVASPDGKVVAMLRPGDTGPSLHVTMDEAHLVGPVRLGLDLAEDVMLGPGLALASHEMREFDETYPKPYRPETLLRDHGHELIADYVDPAHSDITLRVIVRAYDDGVAFRYAVTKPGPSTVRINEERTAFAFPDDPEVFALPVKSFGTSYEHHYHRTPLSKLEAKLIGLPTTLRHPSGHWSLITEAHLDDYAGMFLVPETHGQSGGAVLASRLARRGGQPAVVRDVPMQSPWRVVMLGRRAGDLVESPIVPRLNPPCAIEDPSWIQPGKVVWPWWSKRMVTGVDFAGGVNTPTMKHYIDFAAENGFDGIVLDEGWYWWANVPGPEDRPIRLSDITRPMPAIDLPELIAYAGARDVGIWLWLSSGHAAHQMDEAFPLFEKWGIAGVKVDFMLREDQSMVNWYHTVARKAAEHKLMVNMHGAYKPTGIYRTWPNMIAREAVLGAEANKWSRDLTPQHNVTLPFTRMPAGPMDYTPGGLDVALPEHFQVRDDGPQVMGTTCHQLAMYVVYFAPLTTVADFPGNYRGHPALPFLREVPTVWDETHVLEGSPGEYIVTARRHGDDWYLAGMNASDTFGRKRERGRSFRLIMEFLPEGATYDATLITDGDRTWSNPRQCEIRSKTLVRYAALNVTMHEFGGFVAKLTPRE